VTRTSRKFPIGRSFLRSTRRHCCRADNLIDTERRQDYWCLAMRCIVASLWLLVRRDLWEDKERFRVTIWKQYVWTRRQRLRRDGRPPYILSVVPIDSGTTARPLEHNVSLLVVKLFPLSDEIRRAVRTGLSASKERAQTPSSRGEVDAQNQESEFVYMGLFERRQ
jgi:hypothetical protein